MSCRKTTRISLDYIELHKLYLLLTNVFFVANHKLCISRTLLDRNYQLSIVASAEIGTEPDNYQLEWHNYRFAVILRLPRNTEKPIVCARQKRRCGRRKGQK